MLTGGDPGLAAQSAGLPAPDEDAHDPRSVVRRLRRPLTDGLARGELPGQLPLSDQIDQELRTARRLDEEVIGPLSQRLADALALGEWWARHVRQGGEAAAAALAELMARYRQAEVEDPDRGEWRAGYARAAREAAALGEGAAAAGQDGASALAERNWPGAVDPRTVLTAQEYRQLQDARARVGRARDTLTRLRAQVALLPAAHVGALAAGDAVAVPYALLMAGEPLPDGWVADIQIPGGLWIRPARRSRWRPSGPA